MQKVPQRGCLREARPAGTWLKTAQKQTKPKMGIMAISAQKKSTLEWRPLQWTRFQAIRLAMKMSRKPDQGKSQERTGSWWTWVGFRDSAHEFRTACLGCKQLPSINCCIRKGKGDSSLAFLKWRSRMGTEAPAGSITEDKESPGHCNRNGNDPLPVFMLCTSVSEVLVRKPTAITMEDGTFTGKALWRSTNLGQFCFFAFHVRVQQSQGRIIPARVRFNGRHLRLCSSKHVLQWRHTDARGGAFARCLSDSAAIREECKLPIQSGGDPQVNQDKSHQCQNLQGNYDIGWNLNQRRSDDPSVFLWRL